MRTALLVLLLMSCAAPEPSICYLKAIGETEDGFTVVVQTCMSPEAFKEAQK